MCKRRISIPFAATSYLHIYFERCCAADVLQVHVSHIGDIKFKGVTDVQSVMQFNTAHLAPRQFPQLPPSAKADLVRSPLMTHCPCSSTTRKFQAAKALYPSITQPNLQHNSEHNCIAVCCGVLVVCQANTLCCCGSG